MTEGTSASGCRCSRRNVTSHTQFSDFSPPPTRLLQGVGRPDEVLACVEAGVDLFESFFPFQVTERGSALSFSFDFSTDPERAGSAPPAGVVNSCA